MTEKIVNDGTDTLAAFRATYLTGVDTLSHYSLVDVTNKRGMSSWVCVRDSEDRILYLNIGGIGSGDARHISVDAHAFVNGVRARTGVMGMDRGLRVSLGEAADDIRHTSHGWPAVGLAVLLLGEQGAKR